MRPLFSAWVCGILKNQFLLAKTGGVEHAHVFRDGVEIEDALVFEFNEVKRWPGLFTLLLLLAALFTGVKLTLGMRDDVRADCVPGAVVASTGGGITATAVSAGGGSTATGGASAGGASASRGFRFLGVQASGRQLLPRRPYRAVAGLLLDDDAA